MTDSSDIDSVIPAESDSETPSAITGALSSGSSSLPEISDSEDDPSLPLPQDLRLRALHIYQGPHQPILSKYKVTVHRGKARSFGWNILPRWTKCSALCAVHLLTKLSEVWVELILPLQQVVPMVVVGKMHEKH